MRRVPELDSMRGLAALGIVMFHYTYPGPLYDHFFRGAWATLEVFFVLSGYLITTIILEYGDRPGFFRNFYARRAIRIWPIYYLFLLAAVVIRRSKPGFGPVDALPQYLTFTQNVELYWSGQKNPFLHVFFPTWSLAIEEQFYLIWPLLILASGPSRGRRRRIALLALATATTSFVSRCLGFSEILLLARSDGFALGGLLAVMPTTADAPGASRARLGFLAAIAIGIAYLTAGQAAQGVPMMDGATPMSSSAAASAAFGLIGIVLQGSGTRAMAPLRNVALRYLGTISYGIYLYHIACFVAVGVIVQKVGGPRWAVLPCSLLACVAVAAASWRFVERPTGRLKSWFPYDPGRPTSRETGDLSPATPTPARTSPPT